MKYKYAYAKFKSYRLRKGQKVRVTVGGKRFTGIVDTIWDDALGIQQKVAYKSIECTEIQDIEILENCNVIYLNDRRRLE